MSRFADSHVCREHRYALGHDARTGEAYLSIPVANRLVDYEEFYRLSTPEFVAFEIDPAAAVAFADQCRARRHDARLILQPGFDRGFARP